MSEATAPPVPPKAKKAAAKKAAAARRAAKSKGVIVKDVTIVGEKYRIRASKFLLMELFSDFEKYEGLEEDELGNVPFSEQRDYYVRMIRLFDGTDATETKKCSRERLQHALDNALVDVEDYVPHVSDVLKSYKPKEGGRPLA